MLFLLLFSSLLARATERCDLFLSTSDRAALERMFIRPPPERMLERVALNRATGMSWTSAFGHAPENDPEYASLEDTFAAPATLYRGHLDGPEMSATFVSAPAPLMNRQLTAAYGIPKDGFTFAMFLTAEEIRAHLGEAFQFPDGAHLRDSLGYIRYYVSGPDAIVVELQSDLFRSLSAEQRERYRHWARHLVFAFERFAAGHLEGVDRVVIAGPEYQRRRWPAFNERGDEKREATLADKLYQHLPKRLGYRATTTDAAFETRTPITIFDEPDDPDTPEPIGDAFARALRTEDSPARREWASHYRAETVNRYREARETLNVFRPAGDARRWPRLVGPSTRVATVGFARMPDKELFRDERTRLAYEELRKGYPEWINQFTRRTIVSTGRAGEFEDVAQRYSVGWRLRATYEHHVGLERHSSLKVGNEFLTVKGSGRRETCGEDDIGTSVLTICTKGQPSHRVWGGLLESHGLHEFNAHVNIWRVAVKNGFEPSIARPVDVGWVDHLFDRGHLIDAHTYQERHLRESPERVVQARYLVKSANRVIAVPNAIRSSSFGRAIPNILREAYAAAGETLTEIPVPPTLMTTENHAEALRWLARVAEANGQTAERILARWAERSLSTMAMVHGFDGHWGGTGSGGASGAVAGGATAARNMSLAGELRDLDENLYLPRIMKVPIDRYRDLALDHTHEMKEQDLRHWEESYYWMSVLLLGRADAPAGVELPRWVRGDPEKPIALRTTEYEFSPEGKARYEFLSREDDRANQLKRSKTDWPGFQDPAFAAAYSKGHRVFANSLIELLRESFHKIQPDAESESAPDPQP